MSIEYTLAELLEVEMRAIDEFRIKESEARGQELTWNEAAEIWIPRYAAAFRVEFEATLEELRNGRPIQ